MLLAASSSYEKDYVELEIDFEQNAQKNGGKYYNEAQRLEKKKAGLEKAITDLEKRYNGVQKSLPTKTQKLIIKREQKWHEKFHWFYTSEKFLVIGGRDAHQNELINSKYFNQGDLFLHADIHGGSVTILIEGERASKQSREEAAQFAACYSKAWETMLNSVNVYALKRSQISKSTEKGSLGTGSFLMKGEREWYMSSKLELVMLVEDGALNIMPTQTFYRTKNANRSALIKQGETKKSDAAKALAKMLGFEDIDLIMRMLPTGTFSISIP